MYCIVPLAGPDVYGKEGFIRPLMPIEGIPLVQKVLQSRPWFNEIQLIFVLRENPLLPQLRKALLSLFPVAAFATVSHLCRGALMSAQAATSLITDFERPVIVDLVDILYKADFSPRSFFEKDDHLMGIIPYFISDNPKYSYLELDEEGSLIEAKEKVVISSFASAGTYFFRHVSAFLLAAADTITDHEEQQHQNNLFVCPSFNALSLYGDVQGVSVELTQSLSLQFHSL